MWHINFLKFVCETGSRQPVCFAYLLEKIVERDRVHVKITIGLTDKQYRNFRSFTRTADYPHRPIIAYGEKKSHQITRTGR